MSSSTSHTPNPFIVDNDVCDDDDDDVDHYTETDPLLDSDSDFLPDDVDSDIGRLPTNHSNSTGSDKLPCIIRDVEAEVKEAQQSQSHIYPEQRQCQRVANRILCVKFLFCCFGRVLGGAN